MAQTVAKRVWVASIGLAAVAVAALLLSLPASPPAPAPAGRAGGAGAAGARAEVPASPAYAGARVCAECHAREHEEWRGSHHDLAMQRADESSVLGDFNDATFEHAGVATTFFRRDGRFVVRTEGPGGAAADFPIAYTFGVTPLQQYLVEFPGGRLQCLGVAWDSRPREEGGQRWFHLYPDDPPRPGEPLHWTGVDQTWNHMCAECHSTGVRKNFSAGRYDTTWTELNVSCEACHGPGSAHVAWARLPEPSRPADGAVGLTAPLRDRRDRVWAPGEGAALVRPGPGPVTHAEVEVCAHCHSRRGTLHEPRIPGRPIGDTHRIALLEEGLYHADGQIDGEVFEHGSFLQSRMFAAGVTCSDCHNPHSGRLRVEGNALCAQCHAPAVFDTPAHHFHTPGEAGSRCVDCHMPEKMFMVVDGRRDHGFRVPRPDLAAALGTPDACTGCHADRSAAWAAGVVAERLGARERPAPFAPALAAARASPAGAGAELAALALDAQAPAIVRATAAAALLPSRGSAALGALWRALSDPDPLVRAAAASAADAWDAPGLLPALSKLASDPVRAVRMEAGLALAEVPASLLGPDAAARDRAVGDYRGSQELNADRPEARFNIGVLEQRLGRAGAAEAAYRAALEIDATFVPARVNLADVLASQGRADEAATLLRAGLDLAPDEAVLSHALGLALVRAGRAAEALAPLERAAELLPREPRYGYVLAVALNSSGRTDRALEVLAGVHQRHPADRDVLAALATIHQDAGRRDQALIWARKLLELDGQDPAARALLAELEGR